MPQPLPRPNCLMSLRQSRGLVITLVFVAMMLDVVLMTSIDPILPSILAKIWDTEAGGQNSSTVSVVTTASTHPPTTVWPTSSTTTPPGMTEGKYLSLSLQIGVLVAAKPLLEMMTNIGVGLIVDRCGHRLPMLIGFLFNFAATVGFGYAPTYWWLLATRLAQAVGSSLSVVSGLAFLAAAFPDDQARCDATGKAFGGISLGIIVGYPYGSAVYEFLGPQAPFLILGAATLADGALRMLVVLPSQDKPKPVHLQIKQSGCKIFNLLTDPYILIGLGCSFVQHFGLGVFLATGPAWMLDDLHAKQWNIGVVLAIAVIFHFTAQCITGKWAIKLGRWLFCWFGLMIFSLGIACYPLCTNIWEVLGPEITVRLGHGTVLCAVSPLLAHVADVRHDSQYGLVYGLYTASYNLGLGLGPIVGGQSIKYISFTWLYWGTAAVIFAYSFLTISYKRLGRIKQINNKVVPSYGATEAEKSPLLGETESRRVCKAATNPPCIITECSGPKAA